MARLPRRMLPATLYLALVCALLAPSFAPVRRAVAAGATNGPAALVKDIDTRLANLNWWGSVPSGFVSIGGTTYFSAQLDSSGFELWKTDGTANGTVLLRDIYPGPEDSRPYGFTDMNGTVFFSATSSSSSSRQLWKTDGTSAGTQLVEDINPNSSNISIYSLTNLNGTLFFLADDSLGYSGRDLWKSDGTSAGTTLVKHLTMTVPMLFNINGTLFFNASDSATGAELWKSDGTTAGTLMVKDINSGPNGSEPTQLTNRNGTLFFLAYDSSFKESLWKSDGSDTGTVLVDPSGALTAASELINVNGMLFFSAIRPQEFGGIWSIWKSDGTAAGTSLVKDVDPGFAGSPSSYGFRNINGTLYFVGRDAATGGELWKSDGTPAGTLMVKDINAGAADSSPHDLTILNGAVFFSATQNYETELWRTDGSAAGTVRVKDIAPGPSSSNPAYLVNANGVLLFSANDSVIGAELWKSDGTSAGTTLVKDIDPDAGSAFGDNAPGFTDVNGTLFFAADAGLNQRGLWKSDGTANGTSLIKSFPDSPTTVDPMPTNLTNVNGALFFVAGGDTTGRELWKSDGTSAGTMLVKDINPDSGDYAHISELTNVNGLLFFSANDSTHGQELWKSDGTSAHTTLVKDINPGINDSSPMGMTSLGGKIYFGASDGIHGAELWQSDGTEAGTLLVKDINPGTADGFAYNVPQMINANGMLFMVATDGTSGAELWRSNGSAAGTTLVKDINPGTADAFMIGGLAIPPFTPLNGMWFFAADDGTHGRELWKTDGTAIGTVLVKDIVPGAATSYPDWFTIVNGRLLFSVESPIGNFDLWRSDGTTAGTSLVKASSPNDFKLMHGPIAPVGNTGKALFSAYDGPSGVELWQTDGTVAGTQLLQNIAAGSIPSNPERFTLAGARMFFLADDHAHSRELWSLPLSIVAAPGSAQVTPAGGSATFANVDLSFPPNAVTAPITITYSGLVTPTHPLGGTFKSVGVFKLEARDSAGQPVTHFAQPYTLTISYTDEQLAALGIDENDLNLAFWNGSAWVNVLPCAGCGVDTVNNRLTAVLDHFTEFALFSGELPAAGDRKSRLYLALVRR
jgi:ELWxxDGT repeat protein